MSAYSLKKTFVSSNINENLELEEGFLTEQITDIVKQIINKQLNRFTKQGQLKLSTSTLNILKKLNKLGVKNLYGYNLSRAIPALERELNMDFEEEDNVALLLKKIMDPGYQRRRPYRYSSSKQSRFPVKKNGKVVRWASYPKAEKPEGFTKFGLKEFFGKDANDVEIHERLGYDSKIKEPDYDYVSGRNSEPKNKTPESPVKDASDVTPPVSDDDVIAALMQDNAVYDEFDNALGID